MATQTDSYAHHLPAARKSQMKIDSLLNPSTGERDSTSSTPYSRHGPMSSSSHEPGYTPLHSPGYIASTPSPTNQSWYERYAGYHDTSPGAASSTTHASSASRTTSMNTQRPHHDHHQQQPHQQYHHQQQQQHNMFLSYQTAGSAPSSPDPYQPRERFGSVSSSSSTNGTDGRRPPRPKYEEEEMYFIWYHRVDLCQEWKEVRESFNRQFPGRQRRGFQGIQCKFYRFIKEKQCPTLREQRRLRDGQFMHDGGRLVVESNAPRYGVVERANVWYPWMREDRSQVLERRMS